MSQHDVHDVIAKLVPPGSRVLDLGCGNGALLAHLRDARQCTGYGIELDDAKVMQCVQRGVNVIQRNLEEGLSLFEDNSFDVVLQIDTLQHLRNTVDMLRETDCIWIAASRRSFPVAVYLDYALQHTDKRVCLMSALGHMHLGYGMMVLYSRMGW